MKPPRWMVIEPKSQWRKSADGKSVIVGLRIRKWHPGFWWAAFQWTILRRRP